MIKLSNGSCTEGVENPDNMHEDRFPDAQLEFVHEVHNE